MYSFFPFESSSDWRTSPWSPSPSGVLTKAYLLRVEKDAGVLWGHGKYVPLYGLVFPPAFLNPARVRGDRLLSVIKELVSHLGRNNLGSSCCGSRQPGGIPSFGFSPRLTEAASGKRSP